MIFYILCEDILSKIVIEKILNQIFYDKNILINAFGRQEGKGYIKKKINDINNSNAKLLFFVLVDLDNEICPSELISKWFKRPCRENLIFRIAVREIESWLLADAEGLSKFLNMDIINIVKEVQNPDELIDPKSKLLYLTNKCRKKELKEDIIRIDSDCFRQGPGYNSRLSEFVVNFWNIERAITKSESLNRAISALKRIEI